MRQLFPHRISGLKLYFGIFFSFFSVMLIPAAASISLSITAIDSLGHEVQNANQISFENAVQSVDSTFSVLLDLCGKQHVDSDLSNYIAQSGRNTVDEYEISEALALKILNNDFIKTAYFYLPDKQAVITAKYSCDSESFFQSQYGYSETILQQRITPVRSLSFLDLSWSDDSVAHYGIIQKVVPYDANNQASFILELNSTAFQNELSQLLLIDNSCFLVYDQQKQILSSAEDSVADFVSSQLISYLPLDTAEDKIRIGDEPYLMNSCRSELTGFTYIYLTPSRQLNASLNYVRAYIFSILSISILLSFLLCWFIARKNYTNLYNIISRLPMQESLAGLNTVYRSIEDSISAYADENQALSSLVNKQSNLLRESFLERLLSGKIRSFTEIAESFRINQIDFKLSCYTILLFDISDDCILFGDDSINDLEKSRWIHFIFHNILSELCQDIGTVYLVDMDTHYACILNHNQTLGKTLAAHLKQITDRMCWFVQKEFNIQTGVFISESCMSPEKIPEIYKKVCTEMENSHQTHLDDYAACVKACMEIVKTQYADNNLCVSAIAQQLQLSPSYLSRYFKQQVGVGLLDYLHQYRIEAVKKLIDEQPDLPTGVIAEQTGFYNAAALIRIFKKYEGVTPGQYRK